MTCCFLLIRREKLNGEADVPSGNGKRTHIDFAVNVVIELSGSSVNLSVE